MKRVLLKPQKEVQDPVQKRNFSKHTWVYFLKLKSEVFDMLLTYKALFEK